jgi:hypothetical protein
VKEIETTLERGAIRASVQFGRNERKDKVRELVMEFVDLACRETGPTKRRLQGLVERVRMRAGERTGEERDRPRMCEKHAAGRMREQRKFLPPAVAWARELDLAIELIGNAGEQALLVADVSVERHWRYAESLSYLAHTDGVESALVRKCDGCGYDGVAIES